MTTLNRGAGIARRGENPMAIDSKTLIGIGVSIIVLAAFLPTAMDTFFNVSTTSWSTGAAALWPVIPLVVLAAIVLQYLKGRA